jgi:hypothetical protein
MQDNLHFFANWAKERLDEMDATLTSLEGKLTGVQTDARDKASKVLADLEESGQFPRRCQKTGGSQRDSLDACKDETGIRLERLRGGCQQICR